METEWEWRRVCGVVSLLTAYVLVVHGYHPYAEDGGLYVAGIKKLLCPALYPHWTEFVTEHLRFSLFAPMVAGIARVSPLRLEWVLLLLYCGSVWATLLGGWMVVPRVGAVVLLAGAMTVPIAGTSLILADPYLTARSFSTPLVMFALAWASRRRWGLCAGALVVAGVLHPLMAGYGVAAVVVVAVTQARAEWVRRFGPWGLLGTALGAAGVVQALAPSESADYVWVAMTRYYWFPFRWEWYEMVGLVAPLGVIWWLGRVERADIAERSGPVLEMNSGILRYAEDDGEKRLWESAGNDRTRQTLARVALVLGGISLVVAVAFCRARLGTHLVARMQPLRCFQMVYEVMLLLLGAWLGERVLRDKVWRWGVLVLGLGGLMFFVQAQTYPASAHVEWPGRVSANPWVRAFVWVRRNTPEDALFALDAHYITRDGEDAQTFRAIAERSAVADYSKDGGEASITPELTEAWVRGQAAGAGLDVEGDEERLGRLEGLGVGWVVLEPKARTGWSCPDSEGGVRVCRVPVD